MAQNPEALYARFQLLLQPEHRSRLLARGLARSMVWRAGIIPDGGPNFAEDLTADLLDFGYGLLAIALDLRDANLTRAIDAQFAIDDGFRVAAEALESAVRRGPLDDPDRARHLVIAASSLHLAGYAARSYSLLPPALLNENLASVERALGLLLRRDLAALRTQVIQRLGDNTYTEGALVERLANENDLFDSEDAAISVLSTQFHQAMGLLDSALILGDEKAYGGARELLLLIANGSQTIGNIPMWWAATMARHLTDDLWGHSLHNRLPEGPPNDLGWKERRRLFVRLLGARTPPQVDLWPSQTEAARRAFDSSDDLVAALPTSAGKTRIAELCILRALSDDRRILYVTPLRALSAQIEHGLSRTFVPLGASVTALYGAIGETEEDASNLLTADIVVATPEKLDFALRQDPTVLDSVGLIVFDEGHMIGMGSREIRYEVLIQRLLRRDDAGQRRIVCLSAMFNPNDDTFRDFKEWLRSDDPGEAIHVKWRPTRQLLAALERQGGDAKLSFLEGERPFVPQFFKSTPATKPRKNPFPHDDMEFCVAAANAFAKDGHTILVYSPVRRQIEPLVEGFLKAGRQGFLTSISRPPAKALELAEAIGREWLGEEHPAMLGLAVGVGAHHGALPRPFLSAVEELLDRGVLPVVVASPTLAQGIDLKCGVLLFRSIHRPKGKDWELIPASEFANVVGRAGRAYVDLDGVAALPIFKVGPAKTRAISRFRSLIERSREQRLASGLVTLVNELATAIRGRLEITDNQFYDYVLNRHDLWSDPRLTTSAQDEAEDVHERTLIDFVEELDIALFSIVDLDTALETLAASLDDALRSSLWARTLARKELDDRVALREVLVSRARWLWRNTSAEQRKACFSSGLGYRAGAFIHDHLEELLSHLLAIQGAALREEPNEVSECVLALADVLEPAPFFRARTRPTNWREVLTSWVKGVAFEKVLASCDGGDSAKAQQFIQDTVIFKLVWAAEAARVQAVARDLESADMLGDAPALVLTYGVPSRRAAVLCQAGLPSRVGALWACTMVPLDFHGADGQRRWFRELRKALAKETNWPARDQWLMWTRWQRSSRGPAVRRWSERAVELAVAWHKTAPPPSAPLRIIAPSGLVCDSNLTPLGRVTAYSDASANFYFNVHATDRGSVTAEAFGPSPEDDDAAEDT